MVHYIYIKNHKIREIKGKGTKKMEKKGKERG